MRDRCGLLMTVVTAIMFAAAGVQCWAGESGAGVLSLTEALDMALARDVLVRDAQQALEAARAALVQAQAYTPRLIANSSASAASSAGLDPESEVTGTDYSSRSYQSSLDVPLPGGMNLGLFTSASTSTTNSALRTGGGMSFSYGGAAVGASLSQPLPLLRDERALTEGGRWQARIGLQSAELALEEARHRVISEAIARFLSAVRVQRQAEIAAASKREADELVRIAQEKLSRGKLAEIEVMEARVSAESAAVVSRKAQSAAAGALDELKNFLGLPLEQEVHPTYDEAALQGPSDLGESLLIERALAQRSDLKQLALGIRSAELGVRQAEARARPAVFLSGGYSRSGQAESISESFQKLVNPSWSVGIATVASLTRREDRARTEQARSALRFARLGEQARRDEVRLEIRRLIRELQDAAANSALLAETVKMAEENLRIRQVQFDHGLVRSVDVTQSERQLSETRNQQLSAVIDYQLAAARLKLAVGEMPFATQLSSAAEAQSAQRPAQG